MDHEQSRIASSVDVVLPLAVILLLGILGILLGAEPRHGSAPELQRGSTTSCAVTELAMKQRACAS